ncbi:MAG: hypothetical protein IJ957_04415, partial [Rikenellaceae bacterium]|nr:hypothetical protein [Rikenellaceae bacterium]
MKKPEVDFAVFGRWRAEARSKGDPPLMTKFREFRFFWILNAKSRRSLVGKIFDFDTHSRAQPSADP